jgi:hypothetical protein
MDSVSHFGIKRIICILKQFIAVGIKAYSHTCASSKIFAQPCHIRTVNALVAEELQFEVCTYYTIREHLEHCH